MGGGTFFSMFFCVYAQYLVFLCFSPFYAPFRGYLCRNPDGFAHCIDGWGRVAIDCEVC